MKRYMTILLTFSLVVVAFSFWYVHFFFFKSSQKFGDNLVLKNNCIHFCWLMLGYKK